MIFIQTWNTAKTDFEMDTFQMKIDKSLIWTSEKFNPTASSTLLPHFGFFSIVTILPTNVDLSRIL